MEDDIFSENFVRSPNKAWELKNKSRWNFLDSLVLNITCKARKQIQNIRTESNQKTT